MQSRVQIYVQLTYFYHAEYHCEHHQHRHDPVPRKKAILLSRCYRGLFTLNNEKAFQQDAYNPLGHIPCPMSGGWGGGEYPFPLGHTHPSGYPPTPEHTDKLPPPPPHKAPGTRDIHPPTPFRWRAVITSRNEVVAKVMFLHVSVILYTGGGGLWRTPPGTSQTPPPDQGEPPRTKENPPRTRQTPPGTRQTPPGRENPPPGPRRTPPPRKKTAAYGQ